MKIRDERIDTFFMEVLDIIGKNYDTGLDKATNVAEQIAEKANDMLEEKDAE